MALTVLVACAGPSGLKPLDRPALRASQARTLAVVKTATPQFAASTSEGRIIGAFFGAAGAVGEEAISGSKGERLAREKRIADPAIDIGWSLAQSLMRKYSLQFVKTSGQPDLVLEIATTDWGYRPTGLGRYGVTYDGRVRLVDTRTRAVVAEGVCSSHPMDGAEAPSHDELLRNDGATLKDLVRSIRDFCLRDYRTRIFGLYDSLPTPTDHP